MLNKRIQHILVFLVAVFVILCLKETIAFPYLEDDLFGNRIDKNWSYHVPSVDEMADFWVKSQVDRKENLYHAYSEDDEMFDDEFFNEPPQVLTDSYEIGNHNVVKVYCVISKEERNCMEVGMKKSRNSPVKIRIRSSPKIIKKKIDGADNQSSTPQENDLSNREKHNLNFSENVKQKHNADSRRKKREAYDNPDLSYDEEVEYSDEKEIDLRDESTNEPQDDEDYTKELREDFYEDEESESDTSEPEDGAYDYNEPEHGVDDYNEPEHGADDYNEPEDGGDDYNEPERGEKDYNEPEHGEYDYDEPEDGEDDYNEPEQGEHYYDEPEYGNDDYNKPQDKNHFKSEELEKSEEPAYDWYRCKLPKKAKNAEILCKKWPSAVSCNLYCAYGFRFPEGIQRTTSCKYSEGKWTKQFSECQPYMDCSVGLRSPGLLFCTTNHLNRGAECQISCEKSGMSERASKKKYICAAEGRWGPQLPHCAESEGLDVLPPPKVTAHRGLYYPNKYPK